MKHGKKYTDSRKLVDSTKLYEPAEALDLCAKTGKAKFDETVEIHVRLGVDSRHADQQVRGAVVLPNGTGKSVRVLCFARGDAAEAAKAAGAEFVGAEDMMEKIQKENWMDFDVVIATPDMMGIVGRLGKILGPRGLMPNPKTGTVTDDTAKAVKEVKAGRVDYKVDKNANISAAVGKLSFSNEGITENIVALIDSVVKARPASAKGAYIESVTVSCAMCPGLPVDTASIAKL